MRIYLGVNRLALHFLLDHMAAFVFNSFSLYRVGKSMFTVVRMEKDMQVMIITIALLITTIIIMIQIRT
jgi:hypothetical protein